MKTLKKFREEDSDLAKVHEFFNHFVEKTLPLIMLVAFFVAMWFAVQNLSAKQLGLEQKQKQKEERRWAK